MNPVPTCSDNPYEPTCIAKTCNTMIAGSQLKRTHKYIYTKKIVCLPLYALCKVGSVGWTFQVFLNHIATLSASSTHLTSFFNTI